MLAVLLQTYIGPLELGVVALVNVQCRNRTLIEHPCGTVWDLEVLKIATTSWGILE